MRLVIIAARAGAFYALIGGFPSSMPRLLHGSTWISLRALGHRHIRVLLGNAKP